MNFKHYPNFKIEEICKIYTKEEGVPISYVCTTDLKASDIPVDVFYRETPHPKFGNRYFGLYWDNVRDAPMITNADIVEEFQFGVVENDNGELEYSESHHAYKQFENGNMIDGGRQYVRASGPTDVYIVKDGKLVLQIKFEEYSSGTN